MIPRYVIKCYKNVTNIERKQEWYIMRVRIRMLIVAAVMLLGMFAGAQTALAQEQDSPVQSAPSDKRGLQSENGYLFYYKNDGYPQTGWKKIKKKIYYFRKDSAEAPLGSAVTGIQKIGSGMFCFNKNGVLQTGWQTVGGKRYCCAASGKLGQIGKMYTGIRKINKKYYFFDTDGRMITGWVLYKNKRYYFNKKKASANYGAAYTGWNTIGKDRYYFTTKGVMKQNCWIGNKYYVGSDGKMLKDTVTPDGYRVDSNGVKGKLASGLVEQNGDTYYYSSGKVQTGIKKVGKMRYYFGEDGVRQENGWVTVGSSKYYIVDGVIQTGWVVCDGKRYYFNSNGKLVTNKTVDGVQLGADGSAPLSASVLLIAGHGQGDCGAFQTYGSTTYYEENFTRQFATLVYNKLRSVAPGITVTMYDQNYNLYKVLCGASGPKPDFKAYDYILEIHFNALDDSLKDPKGDGKCHGTGMYVDPQKKEKDSEIDEKIVAAVAKASGLPVWGGGKGVFRDLNLLNARTARSQGVSYGLLETAFIDDRDDMKIYNKKKNAMALAVATTIKEYFGV